MMRSLRVDVINQTVKLVLTILPYQTTLRRFERYTSDNYFSSPGRACIWPGNRMISRWRILNMIRIVIASVKCGWMPTSRWSITRSSWGCTSFILVDHSFDKLNKCLWRNWFMLPASRSISAFIAASEAMAVVWSQVRIYLSNDTQQSRSLAD